MDLPAPMKCSKCAHGWSIKVRELRTGHIVKCPKCGVEIKLQVNFVFSHGIGPSFAFGVARRLRLFAHLGVGFSLVSTTTTSFPKIGSVDPIDVGFAVDCAVGAQLFR